MHGEATLAFPWAQHNSPSQGGDLAGVFHAAYVGLGRVGLGTEWYTTYQSGFEKTAQSGPEPAGRIGAVGHILFGQFYQFRTKRHLSRKELKQHELG